MEIDLKTRLGTLELTSPIIVGSCPMTTDDLQRISMISNGAGAIVLPSIIVGSAENTASSLTMTNNHSVDEYLRLIEHVAAQESVPVIASLNGNLNYQWDKLSARIESAGAAGIELSLRSSGTTHKEPREIEDEIVALTKQVDAETNIPLFLKLTRYFTNVSHFARRLQPYVQGMVLFGRSPVIDLELDSMKLSTSWGLTEPGSIVQNLESLMRTREEFPEMPLVACGGIGTSVDLIKALIAGANATMVTSALYRNGPSVIGTLKDGLVIFMSDHGIDSIEQLRQLCPPLSNVQTEIETLDYQPTVGHETQASSLGAENTIECDRYGHPKNVG